MLGATGRPVYARLAAGSGPRTAGAPACLPRSRRRRRCLPRHRPTTIPAAGGSAGRSRTLARAGRGSDCPSPRSSAPTLTRRPPSSSACSAKRAWISTSCRSDTARSSRTSRGQPGASSASALSPTRCRRTSPACWVPRAGALEWVLAPVAGEVRESWLGGSARGGGRVGWQGFLRSFGPTAAWRVAHPRGRPF